MSNGAPGRWYTGRYHTARDAGEALGHYYACLDGYAGLGVDIRDMHDAILGSAGHSDPYALRDHLNDLRDRLEQAIKDACWTQRDLLFWGMARARGRSIKEIAKSERTAQEIVDEILARVDSKLEAILYDRGMMTRRIQ